MLFAVDRSAIEDATQERGPICGRDTAQDNCAREKLRGLRKIGENRFGLGSSVGRARPW
jgi:hypothetical protein